MANFQPKIYSLSTLNIRQHFNCDYRFHEFRTDFSGESGSGKSLIADFIQLLLVGSGFFKSGTEGINQRDTSGLVLKSAGGKYGRGYLLLNIQLQPHKYITLGGYLETTSSQMQFFIVQAGYDFEENLLPMSSPIFYRDLLINGKIETLTILEKNPLEKGYIKAVSNKKYHQLLYNNGILAVDLSENKQSLKSYAAILRSFSRGKGFSTNSDSLKAFLFGDDDQRQLSEKYRNDVQNINADKQQHQRLLEEIASIRNKEQKIENVSRDFNTYHSLKLQFCLENISFWFQAHKNILESKSNVREEYLNAAIFRSLTNQKLLKIKIDDITFQYSLIKKLKIKIATTSKDKKKLEAELKQKRELLVESTKYKNIIDVVKTWFTDDREDLIAIQKWYLEERSKIINFEILKNFEQFLSENELVQNFKQSYWFKDYSQAGKLSVQELKTMANEIERQETQLIFSNLDNPNSLAHWAIQHLDLPLSLEKESILIHFQPLPRSAPTLPADRYLPFPERLFEKPIIVKTNNNGFWLELNGIYEFIDYTPKQYLNLPIDQINLDHESLDKLQQQLEGFRLKYNQLKNLKEKLETYSGLEKAVSLYKTNQTELFPEINEIAQLIPAEFNRYISIFKNSAQYLATYEIDNIAYEEAFANAKEGQNAEKKIQSEISRIEADIKKQYGEGNFNDLLNENTKHLNKFKIDLKNLVDVEEIQPIMLQTYEAQIIKLSSSLSELYDTVINAENEYNKKKNHFDEIQNSYNSSIAKLNDAKITFIRDYQRDFEPNEDLVEIECEPDQSIIIQARNTFENSYKVASEGIEDKIILQDFSVGILAHKLLPTVFPTQQIREDLIGEQIQRRLTDLTNDLQEIGSRKIEILHNVFKEVWTVYNDYLTKIQSISNYLRSKDRQITGGNYATLEQKSAIGYPDNWMKIFRKRVNSETQNIGLFASDNKQDINDIMISAFQDAGGTKDATVNDLLNPRSYFDLLFDIKLTDGQSNAGSNGQTYTANALLCLARLSLIQDNNRSGIKIMPIDEAEGLGSNYEMLHALAKKENYQIVTMSIETAGDINDDGQYIYIMHDNNEVDKLTYVPPLGIFKKGKLTENINEIFDSE